MDERMTIGAWMGNASLLPPALIGLDTWALTHCTRLVYEPGLLELAMEGDGHRLILRCEGVSNVVFPPMQPQFWTPAFEIWDVSSAGMEGIKYRLQTDEDTSEFRCFCRSISIMEA